MNLKNTFSSKAESNFLISISLNTVYVVITKPCLYISNRPGTEI